jgi:TolB-like protein/Tfp pilus assembly protein PilF
MIAEKAGEYGQYSTRRPVVRIHLLGPIEATTCFGDDLLPHSATARAAFGYLCLASSQGVRRAQLAALLWDQMAAAAARTELSQVLRELSSAFGAFAHELIDIGRDVVKLRREACWIDVLAILALEHSTPPDALPADLATVCRGKLLEDLDGVSASFDQWLLGARARVTDQAQSLLESALMPTGPKTGGATLSRFRSSHRSGRNRVRIGVLPLTADGLKREEGLAISLTQHITSALARFRWFDVIAALSPGCGPSSYFVNEHQIRRMNLDYILDWTISGQDRDVRINILLLDLAERTRPLWRDSFDLARGDLHRLSELVTNRIVGCIDPFVPLIEGYVRHQDHYGATGLLLLAIPLMLSMERDKYEQSGRLINRALQIDPDNSMAAAWAAHWHLFYGGQRWTGDMARTHAATKDHALRAMKLDPENAEALGIYGHICSMVDKDLDSARRHFDRSLRLNPSLAFVWAFSGLAYCYAGEPDAALPRLDRYRDLAPFDAYLAPHETIFAVTHTFRGDYERAALAGRRVVETNPDFVAAYKPLVAALGHLGRREEAKPYVDKLLTLEPKFTVENFGEVYPIKKASDRKRYMEGLRLAGVPER